MNFPESKAEWRERLQPVIKEVKQEPIGSSIFLILLVLYLSGFVFNNAQNQNALFSLAWFYDAILLSWTNLLILPILLLSTPWKRHNRDWGTFKDFAKMHLYSPLLWILGYLGLRLAYKTLSVLSALILELLNWLGT